jgi:hypothetical protein
MTRAASTAPRYRPADLTAAGTCWSSGDGLTRKTLATCSGNHQFRLPNSFIALGTSSARTIVTSIRGAACGARGSPAHPQTSSPQKGVTFLPVKTTEYPSSRDFSVSIPQRVHRNGVAIHREASPCVARTRDYVRNVSACSARRQLESIDLQALPWKPSDGLEPSTPSL